MITVKDSDALSKVRPSRAADERKYASSCSMQTHAELLGLVPGQDPVRGSVVTAGDDLISWLCPQHVVLGVPPLSESDDMESWIDGIVNQVGGNDIVHSPK